MDPTEQNDGRAVEDRLDCLDIITRSLTKEYKRRKANDAEFTIDTMIDMVMDHVPSAIKKKLEDDRKAIEERKQKGKRNRIVGETSDKLRKEGDRSKWKAIIDEAEALPVMAGYPGAFEIFLKKAAVHFASMNDGPKSPCSPTTTNTTTSSPSSPSSHRTGGMKRKGEEAAAQTPNEGKGRGANKAVKGRGANKAKAVAV